MDVNQMKSIPLFQDVPDDSLRKVATFAQLESHPEGAAVVKEGAYANDFYAIEDGTAKVERNGQQLAELGPGDVFGEQALLEGEQRSASVIATSPLRVIRIAHWELNKMKRDMPQVVDELKEQVQARKG
ncbi:MAG TPA: cyclic nucleotide-binding domain-containing protein [Solirubrobacterales bacterium]|nr:cyclic nucleotide-binding domain-containing protein [Solirubrobacterales bacterium]